MVQPKYSPEEALQKIKLMMKYDSSKTLNENKQTINELDDTGRSAVTGTLGSATAGALASTAMGAGYLGGVGGTAGGAALAVGEFLLPASAGAGTALAVGGAAIAGLAGLALIPLAYWLINKDNNTAKVKKFFEMCSTDAAKIAKLQRKIDDKTIRDMSDNINDAVNYHTWGFMAGTDEEKLFAQFKAIQDGTASDFCALVNQYNKNYGDLFEDLDSDIDSDDEWNQIFRPLRNCVEDSLLTVAEDTQKECKDNPNQEKCKAIVQGEGYKDCTGLYQKGCKSDVIAKVQGCLGGLVQDGKFGPKTEAKLKEKFPEFVGGFRDSEVEKICAKASTTSSDEIVSVSDTGEEGEDFDELINQ